MSHTDQSRFQSTGLEEYLYKSAEMKISVPAKQFLHN